MSCKSKFFLKHCLLSNSNNKLNELLTNFDALGYKCMNVKWLQKNCDRMCLDFEYLFKKYSNPQLMKNKLLQIRKRCDDFDYVRAICSIFQGIKD